MSEGRSPRFYNRAYQRTGVRQMHEGMNHSPGPPAMRKKDSPHDCSCGRRRAVPEMRCVVVVPS